MSTEPNQYLVTEGASVLEMVLRGKEKGNKRRLRIYELEVYLLLRLGRRP